MSRLLTPNDLERSRTSFSIDAVIDALRAATTETRPKTLLDVGCGYGGIAATLRRELDLVDVRGVDIDEGVLDEARSKGVDASLVDVGSERLPYEDGTFDLVTCFGMLDYLPWYDVAVQEFSRVVRPGGLVAVALPNLGSWHNRLALLLGYQPRDVEFCSIKAVGLAPLYRSDLPVGHVHTPTTRAFQDFMTLMGFDEVRTHALSPENNPASRPLRMIDAVAGRFPALARRFLYVGRRTAAPLEASGERWWPAK